MVTSMSDQSSLFDQTICEDTSNATSSQASADGRTRSGSRVGLTIGTCGRALVHASDSRAPHAGDAWLLTAGQLFDGLSLQAGLERSLASRLPRRAIGLAGSRMIWKSRVTRSGRRFCRLALLGSITNGSGGIGLRATPTATANQSCPSMRKWAGCRGLQVTPAEWCRRMTYPIAWLSFGVLAMRSYRSSRRSSSAHIAQSEGR